MIIFLQTMRLFAKISCVQFSGRLCVADLEKEEEEKKKWRKNKFNQDLRQWQNNNFNHRERGVIHHLTARFDQ